MESARQSLEQKNMKTPFWNQKEPMDIVFALVVAWKTCTSIPLRTMRLTRVLKATGAPDQLVYIDDHLCGTWKFHGGNPWKPYPEGSFLTMCVRNEDDSDVDSLIFANGPGTSAGCANSGTRRT